MIRLLAWLTALAMWGGMFYAAALSQRLIAQQGYHIAKRSVAQGEYEITQVVAPTSISTEQRYVGRFFMDGNLQWMKWIANGKTARLHWRVQQGKGMPIAYDELVFLWFRELRAPLTTGMRLRYVRMGYPSGYYLVILNKRGEVVGVLEVIWLD